MPAKAVLIGCATYERGVSPLRFPENDAQELHRRLVDPSIGGYAPADAQLLTSPLYTDAATALAIAFKAAKPDDSVLFYFAGHGLRDDNGELHLALRNSNPDLLEVTSLSAAQVRDLIKRCRSRQICVILDCCFAGALSSRAMLTPGEVKESVNTLSGEGTLILASAQGSQAAREREDLGHGLFTKYLLQGIDGDADVDNDGIITAIELYNFVAQKMEQEVGRSQRPTLSGNISGGSFPLVRNPGRRKQAVAALRAKVDHLCEQRRHLQALALVEEHRKSGHAEDLLQIVEHVEAEKRQLVLDLRSGVLQAAERHAISDRTLQAVLKKLATNPDKIFEPYPTELTDKLLRNYFVGSMDAKALELTWPDPAGERSPSGSPTITTPIQRRTETPPAPPGPPPSLARPGDNVAAPPRRWRRVVVWAAAAAAIAAIWLFTRPTAPPPSAGVRIGVLLKRDWSDEIAKEGFASLAEQLGQRLHRVAQVAPDVTMFTSIAKVVEALRNKQVDIVGELSPRDIFEVRQVGAEPFVTAQYGGSQHYTAFFFVSAQSPLLDPAEQPQREEDWPRTKERTWNRLLRELRDDEGKLAVSDETSTSGYWIPRHQILGEFRARQWTTLSFRDVTISMSSQDVLESVACRRQRVVVGVIASYRLKPNERIWCGGGYAPLLLPVNRTAGILNGGFVIRSELARDGALLRALDNSWENAVEGMPENLRKGLNLPSTWARANSREYASIDPVFEEPDPADEKRRVDQKIALTAAGTILLLCAISYYAIAVWRHRRTAAALHP